MEEDGSKGDFAMFRVALATLGCKVNHYETAGLLEKLQDKGITVVPFPSPADLYIINTCTITSKTDFQSRQLIRRAYRANPSAPIIVTGCYAQTAPEDIAALPGVRMVAGTEMKTKIPDILEEILNGSPRVDVGNMDRKLPFSELPVRRFSEQTRAYLKVQDGCNMFCSYCIIPYARGRSRSLPEEGVIRNLKVLTSAGHREVILTGICLGAYGKDLLTNSSLMTLLQRIEEETDLERLRISSLNPKDITVDMINHLRGSRRVCRHLHISMQSGDDRILSLMKRDYTTGQVSELISHLQSEIPDIAIGMDIITGFPGERKEEFQNTRDFIENLKLAYLHVFPYSRRSGTVAAALPDQVLKADSKERAQILREIGSRKRDEFNGGFIGKELSVLVEGSRDKETGWVKGFSDNYVPVLIPQGDMSLANKILDVRAERMVKEKIEGRVLFDG